MLRDLLKQLPQLENLFLLLQKVVVYRYSEIIVEKIQLDTVIGLES